MHIYIYTHVLLFIHVSIYSSTSIHLSPFSTFSTYSTYSTYPINLPILSTYLPIYLSTYLPTYLSICLRIYPSMHLCIHASIHPCIHPSIYTYSYVYIYIYIHIIYIYILCINTWMSTVSSSHPSTVPLFFTRCGQEIPPMTPPPKAPFDLEWPRGDWNPGIATRAGPFRWEWIKSSCTTFKGI